MDEKMSAQHQTYQPKYKSMAHWVASSSSMVFVRGTKRHQCWFLYTHAACPVCKSDKDRDPSEEDTKGIDVTTCQ